MSEVLEAGHVALANLVWRKLHTNQSRGLFTQVLYAPLVESLDGFAHRVTRLASAFWKADGSKGAP